MTFCRPHFCNYYHYYYLNHHPVFHNGIRPIIIINAVNEKILCCGLRIQEPTPFYVKFRESVVH